MLNLAFLSKKLSCGIDIVLVYLCPYGFNNPRNTLRSKLLQLASICLRIILFGLRTSNKLSDAIAGDSCADERERETWGYARWRWWRCRTRG
jgi:hypothetical protein